MFTFARLQMQAVQLAIPSSSVFVVVLHFVKLVKFAVFLKF